MAYDSVQTYKRTVSSDIYDQMYYANIYVAYLMDFCVLFFHYAYHDRQLAVYESIKQLDNILERGLGLETKFPKFWFWVYIIYMHFIMALSELVCVIVYLRTEAISKNLAANVIHLTIVANVLASPMFMIMMVFYRCKLFNNILKTVLDHNSEVLCYVCADDEFKLGIKSMCSLHILR